MPAFLVDYFMLFIQWLLVWLPMHYMTLNGSESVVPAFMAMIQDIQAQAQAAALIL